MSLQSLKITEAADPFMDAAQKHNALVRLLEQMSGSDGVKVDVTAGRILISLAQARSSGDSSGASGDGLPEGYTFEQFTICDSGSPATRWWPTWTSDPS